MSYTIKPLEELNIMDDFLANAIASDAKIGPAFVRALVRGLLQKELGDNIRINVQRAIQGNKPTQRGIRLDIEVMDFEDDDTQLNPKYVYDIEPNQRKDIDIIKHNRFYQAKIDSQNLSSGEKDFIRLPSLFVITITNYDPFGYDYMLYTIRNKCDEVPKLKYEDGLKFLYFNTTGTKGGNQALKNLLTYIQESKESNVTDAATKELHDYVSSVKVSPEVRVEYMMWEEKIFYEKRDAKEEGRAEGLAEERIRSISIMLAKGKNEEEIAELLDLSIEEVQELSRKKI